MTDPEQQLAYEGPGALIDRAGDTLSDAFIDRLRGMSAASQREAGDTGGGLLPTGGPRPPAAVREEIAAHIARVREQGYTVIENVIPTERVTAIRDDVVAAVDAIGAEWAALEGLPARRASRRFADGPPVGACPLLWRRTLAGRGAGGCLIRTCGSRSARRSVAPCALPTPTGPGFARGTPTGPTI